jgi:hypothetical protein
MDDDSNVIHEIIEFGKQNKENSMIACDILGSVALEHDEIILEAKRKMKVILNIGRIK